MIGHPRSVEKKGRLAGACWDNPTGTICFFSKGTLFSQPFLNGFRWNLYRYLFALLKIFENLKTILFKFRFQKFCDFELFLASFRWKSFFEFSKILVKAERNLILGVLVQNFIQICWEKSEKSSFFFKNTTLPRWRCLKTPQSIDPFFQEAFDVQSYYTQKLFQARTYGGRVFYRQWTFSFV